MGWEGARVVVVGLEERGPQPGEISAYRPVLQQGYPAVQIIGYPAVCLQGYPASILVKILRVWYVTFCSARK